MSKQSNGTSSGSRTDLGIRSRAEECAYVLSEVQKLIIPFIEAADKDADNKSSGRGLVRSDGHGTTIVSSYAPADLTRILDPKVPELGQASDGLLQAIKTVMQYSVNTWDRGFMDKLYASTDAPGLAAELILAALNTNVHVYAVSPALTVIEKAVTTSLAEMFGLKDEDSGGISTQGGSASNLTSLLIARNYRYPEVKSKGMNALAKQLVIFTSKEAHYSASTAAVSLGFGSEAVYSVPIDQHGCMDVSRLEDLILQAKKDGKEPFYVSATSGTTVRGAYDPLEQIGQICKKHKLWFHIDAAWGGPAIFSRKHRHKLSGSHLADSIACNPHKMMGVPVTCSFLLGQDLTKFYAANSLSAGYLFHNDPEDALSASETHRKLPSSADIYDLASLTPQCGRRGDSLKLYLSWVYHGTAGYEKQIDAAFAACQYMVTQVSQDQDFHLISDDPPPCCQCCFYYWPNNSGSAASDDSRLDASLRTETTRRIVAGLVEKGWMIDYAPGELGEFLRVVTNRGTTIEIVDGLLKAIKDTGAGVMGTVQTGRRSKMMP